MQASRHRVVVVDKLKWDKCGYPEKQNDYLDLLACNIKNEMCTFLSAVLISGRGILHSLYSLFMMRTCKELINPFLVILMFSLS